MNSRLVKENGKLEEKVWKVGGLYTQAIEKIVYWLKKAETVAENEAQKAVISKLIRFYETGNLKDFDEYAILWVKDLDSRIDFVNGFTESYGDPLGMKASWESLVNFKDIESTHRTEIISSNAQWFEDHSPVDKAFKKDEVKGLSLIHIFVGCVRVHETILLLEVILMRSRVHETECRINGGMVHQLVGAEIYFA